MTSIGYATLSVIPSLKGFQEAVSRSTLAPMEKAGRDAGRRFGAAAAKAGGASGEEFGEGFKRDVNGKLRDANGRFVKDSTAAGGKAGGAAARAFNSDFAKHLKRGAIVGGLAAAYGIGSFIKSSVELEARYGKTMAQMRVATKAPADELQRLDDLAIQLGKETVFSAVDASDAMLELAKNGIKPATIEAGALKSALTLAAAGGVDLEASATAMGNTLNAFRLKGGKAASVAAALAGAANASSASVGSLAEGLQQSSTVAADVGFNVQETTGVLAAFANAGIEGSDAGTSLKTMLSRLMPQTAKAKDYMDRFGLSFIKANGEFKGAVEIAANLKEGLGELSASERSQALNVIFGSDARRAATILTREGAEGIRDYIKATSDQGAAEEMAQANMEGTAGAIERLKGAWETAKLEFGKSIAPVAADFLDYLAENIDDLAPKLVEFGNWFQDEGVPKLKKFSGFVKNDVLPALGDIRDFSKDAAGFVSDLVAAFGKMPDPAKYAGLATLLGGGAALKLRGGRGGALGTVGSALGIAKGTPVYVTNWAQIAGADAVGGGGKVATIGKGVAKALPPVLVIGGLAYTVDKAILDPARKGATRLEPTRQGFDSTLSSIEGVENKAKGYGRTLDLIGSKKVEPKFAVPGLAQGREGLAEFIRLQIAAGKPITPYIQINGFERAMQQIRTLQNAASAVPTAGVDNGATYQHGGTPGISPRAGVNFNGPINVQAHDYDDFTRQLERKSQRAGLGGRP